MRKWAKMGKISQGLVGDVLYRKCVTPRRSYKGPSWALKRLETEPDFAAAASNLSSYEFLILVDGLSRYVHETACTGSRFWV